MANIPPCSSRTPFLVVFGWLDPAWNEPSFGFFGVEARSRSDAFDKAAELLDDRDWLHRNIFNYTEKEEVLEYNIGHYHVWALDRLDSELGNVEILAEK